MLLSTIPQLLSMLVGLQVLRVHVTPTRVKFLLPEVQTGNRVVRHFCAETAGTR